LTGNGSDHEGRDVERVRLAAVRRGRTAPARLIELARSGRLDLGRFAISEFALDDEAVAYAADHGGPFNLTILRP
jgi:hypothetical protein